MRCQVSSVGVPRGSRAIFTEVVCLVSSRIERRIQASVAGKSLEIIFKSN